MAGDEVTKLDKLTKNVLKRASDDDAVDRLNYYWTSLVLLIFAGTVVGKQYMGQPIQSRPPIDPSVTALITVTRIVEWRSLQGQWEKYAEHYCLVENTYWARMNDSFPLDKKVREEREIRYYQWVPYIFLAQMSLFIAPKLVWKMLVGRNSLDFNALVNLATSSSKTGKEGKRGGDKECGEAGQNASAKAAVDEIHRVFDYMDECRRRRRRHSSDSAADQPNIAEGPKEARLKSHASRHSVTISYMVYKFLQLTNTLMELFLLNKLAGPENYKLWGYAILKDLVEGRSWQESGLFPRVTFCDVEVPDNIDKNNPYIEHTFQCVLMINSICEKLFIALWWWLVLLNGINLSNFLKWLYYAAYRPSAYAFVDAKLSRHVRKINCEISPIRLRQFVDEYLGLDGITLLRLIEANSTGTNASVMVYELWKNFDKGRIEGTREKNRLEERQERIVRLRMLIEDNNSMELELSKPKPN